MAKKETQNTKAAKKLLIARQKEVVQLEETAEALQTSVELDQSRIGRLSRMDAIQAHEMEEETVRRRDAELLRIAAALKRIEDDEYGYCVTCGEDISPKRLDADPSVPTCIDCAQR
jgi:DnaK suppressor protein